MTVPGDLAALPKAEINVHLEGTVPPATLEELCARTGIGVPRSFGDLPSFVAVYSCAWATMTTPGDYARLVREYCEDATRAGAASTRRPTPARRPAPPRSAARSTRSARSASSTGCERSRTWTCWRS